MVSRPMVAATVAGAFIGRPPAGLLIGVVLEMIALDTLPFGASRYPEWGSAGVVCGGLFSPGAPGMPSGPSPSPLFALLAAGFSARWLGVFPRVVAAAPAPNTCTL